MTADELKLGIRIEKNESGLEVEIPFDEETGQPLEDVLSCDYHGDTSGLSSACIWGQFPPEPVAAPS